MLSCTRTLRHRAKPPEIVSAQNSDYYDEFFSSSESYNAPYDQSHYYFMWSVIADRMARAGAKYQRILEIGCGPGQFASLLHDKGFQNYLGIDFSPEAVKRASDLVSAFVFRCEDVTQSDALRREPYDWLIALEILEHLTDDLAVLQAIRPGAQVILSVPNFPDPAHIRHFDSCEAVSERYSKFFARFEIGAFRWRQSTWFLLEGERAGINETS